MVKMTMQKKNILNTAIARQLGRALLLSVALVASCVTAKAQVFSCDFESATEQSQWTLNPGNKASQLENKWYIGAAGQFGTQGTNGLFISADGQNATYTAKSQMFTLAYRDLPAGMSGDYTILLDYRVLGSENAKLSVWWLPQSVRIASNTGAQAPTNWGTSGGVVIAQNLRNVSVWQSLKQSFNIPQNAPAGRLVFVWENSQSTPKAPSACIDNIEIYQGQTLCATAPNNLKYTGGVLKWNGSATGYEVCLYNAYTNQFSATQQVTGTSWVPTPSGEGVQYMYVRSTCAGGGHSEWVSIWAFVYQKGVRCIEYFDISDDPSATGVCYTGEFKDFFINKTQGTRQKVDYGYASDKSMHTIHYVNEIDPNTADIDGGLKTIPAGEVASVRLGAYTDSGQSARIEYKYTVQKGMSDLLEFKYAAVLKSGNHPTEYKPGGDYQPTLQLEVLDQNGDPLSSSCTQFLFVTGDNETSRWHYDKNDSYSVYWCDWSTVTVSLRPYVGQTLTVRLTATRCSFDTHYAYAYFTLGCRSGDIEGIACGDFSTDHFTAPDGFTYRWYREDDANRTSILNNEGKESYQTLHIDNDDASIYMLECHNTEDYDCYYTLTCNPNPRFPKAVATATATAQDCQNMVSFTNASQIVYINRETLDSVYTDDSPQEVIWHFGDGQEEVNNGTELTHLYPEEGGVFEPFVVASMSDGICTDTLYLGKLQLPNIKAADTDTTIHLCEGDSYELPSGKVVYNDTTYTWASTNKYGCEATNSIRVRFHQPSKSVRTEELCEGGYVDFEGKRYTETGVYDVHLKTVYGCDSLLQLNLTILPRLVVDVPDTMIMCADDPVLNIPYRPIAGRLSGVAVYFPISAVEQGMHEVYEYLPGEEVNIPMPKEGMLRADTYPLVIDFGAPDCPADPVQMVLQVYYSSLIIEQKNDLIALLNAEYNGGYTWNHYQWYCNGRPVENGQLSYIVVDDSQIGNEFYCVLVRPDGVEMPTCPIVYWGGKTPIDHTTADGMVYPTLLDAGEAIHIRNAKTIRIVDTMGKVVDRKTTDGVAETTMTAPARAGVYFVQTDQYMAKIVVK